MEQTVVTPLFIHLKQNKFNFMNFLKTFLRAFLCFILIISCASDEEVIDNSKEVVPGVKLVNSGHLYTNCDPNDTVYCTNEMQTWINKGVSMMKTQNADVLVVTWNVGKFVSEDGFDKYNTHEVLLTSPEIESILSKISDWLKGTCLSTNQQLEHIKEYRNYLENGADASSQFVLCSNSRIVLAAFETKNPGANEGRDIPAFITHELYHAFQQDLGNQSCTNTREGSSSSNGRAIVEGAAVYFGEYAAGQLMNYDGVNRMLGKIYNDFQGSGDKSIEAGLNWGAGLRLMIERNWLNESSILDGSLFHNCETETLYTNANENIVKIKDLWYMIEKDGDNYKFSDQALGN